MANAPRPTALVTGKIRISYEHLLKAYAAQAGQEEKFSITVILPKSDYATKQKIDAAIAQAIQEGITGKWSGVRPPQVPNPIWDGDGPRQSGEPFPPECRGSWVFTASTKARPEVVDLNCQPIMNATEIYSGMYARASVNFFPYFSAGKKGIGCGLSNVQKLEDGEPLGGRTSAAEDFGSPAAPAQYQAPAYQPPVAPQYHAPVQQYQAPAAPQYAPPAAPVQSQYQQPQPQYAPQAQPQYAPQQSPYAPQPQYQPQPQPQYAPQPQTIDPITGLPPAPPIYGL